MARLSGPKPRNNLTPLRYGSTSYDAWIAKAADGWPIRESHQLDGRCLGAMKFCRRVLVSSRSANTIPRFARYKIGKVRVARSRRSGTNGRGAPFPVWRRAPARAANLIDRRDLDRSGEYVMSILTPLALYTQNISRDSDTEGTAAPEVLSEDPFETCDRMARATVSRATGGLSPAALALAFADWSMHSAFSPGKQIDLVRRATEGAISNLAFAAWSASGADQDPCGLALPHNRRFRGPLWRAPPLICTPTTFSRSNDGGRQRPRWYAA